MDDPISALDANVKKKVFKNVFMKQFASKTRILVTHAVDFLHLVDKVILIKEGRIILNGPFEEVKEDPYLKELMRIFRSHQKEQGAGDGIDEAVVDEDGDSYNSEGNEINGDGPDINRKLSVDAPDVPEEIKPC